MLPAAVKMGAPKIVAALLGGKANPNATNGFEMASKPFFLMIKHIKDWKEKIEDKGERKEQREREIWRRAGVRT